MSLWNAPDPSSDPFGLVGGASEPIELLGPHLRVSGNLNLGRFSRLSDLVNNNRGYLTIHEARLLRRNGDPTALVVPKLMVNPDEVTFIGQSRHILPSAPEEAEPVDATQPGEPPRPEKGPRRYVVFTPGHAIAGMIHVHRDMTLDNFVEATDPRYIPMTLVTARSLADRRVISHFEFMLVNRTQVTAIAETEPGAIGEAVSDLQAG
jgi:hypothetical protein